MELRSDVLNREFLKQQYCRTQEESEKKPSHDSKSLCGVHPNGRITMDIDEWLVGYPHGQRPTAEGGVPFYCV